MITELLEHRVVSDTRQSKWRVRRTFRTADGIKLRATVDQDPYEFQCDYFLEAFSPTDLKWSRIHTETTSWYKGIDALSTDRLTPEKWETIDILVDHMVAVGQDLVS